MVGIEWVLEVRAEMNSSSPVAESMEKRCWSSPPMIEYVIVGAGRLAYGRNDRCHFVGVFCDVHRGAIASSVTGDDGATFATLTAGDTSAKDVPKRSSSKYALLAFVPRPPATQIDSIAKIQIGLGHRKCGRRGAILGFGLTYMVMVSFSNRSIDSKTMKYDCPLTADMPATFACLSRPLLPGRSSCRCIRQKRHRPLCYRIQGHVRC